MKKRTLALASAVMLLATAAGHVASASVVRQEAPDFFQIFFKNIDLSPNVQMDRFTFTTPLWDFGDRAGYRCAWAFLMDGGEPVARVQFDRGASYAGIIDKYGVETNNDMSQCITTGDREIKPKPAGLADTIVELENGAGTLDSLTFQATSGEDSLSWWELEEAKPDFVELELYWGEDVAVVATITSLSPTTSFSARSTAAPAINSFSPSSGAGGTDVEITGANYVGVTSVTFNGAAATFVVHSAGRIVATVPAGATSGPIAVTTPTGTGTSADSFTVGSGGDPDPGTHESKVTLKLSGRLVASGSVSVVDGTTECVLGRTVLIKRRVSGAWRHVGTDATDDAGAYRAKIKNKDGKYRATVKKSTIANGDTCLRDHSKKKRAT